MSLLGEMNERLDFGKHAGETVAQVIESEPQYLVWAQRNTDRVAFSPELMKAIYAACKQRKADHEFERELANIPPAGCDEYGHYDS